MCKDFKDISWDVSEDIYRKDPALSYSTLAKYAREGFNSIPKLFDKIDTPSLTFGSAVDSIITGGMNEFNERFLVADFPDTPDSVIQVVKALFAKYNTNYATLFEIPDNDIISMAAEFNYQNNWKPETRAKVIKEKGNEYYSLMYVAGSKTILNTDLYDQIDAVVKALKMSDATKFYFSDDNPFTKIRRYYQLKFKFSNDNVDYRSMADLIIVDYENKTVIPIDLKTSSHKEWDFYESFVQWRYDIQARLYWRNIRYNMDQDDYFKDFKLLNYRFIVVNRFTLQPLVWEFEDTQALCTLKYGKKLDIELKDPYVYGKELNHYLSSANTLPMGITVTEPNSIRKWLNS